MVEIVGNWEKISDTPQNENNSGFNANANELSGDWERVTPLIPEKEKESKFEDFGEGLGVSALETIYGLKGLVTDLTDEDNAVLKDWRDDAAESWAGTAGQVVGDLGQMVLPGMAGLKVARIGTSLLKQSVAAGILGGIQAPDEELAEGRIGNITKNAGAAFLGGGILKGASKIFTGIARKAPGEKIIARGDYGTPGQVAESSAVRVVEQGMSMIPGVGKGVRELQSRGVSDWLRHTANKVAIPLGQKIDDLSSASMKILKNNLKNAYTNVWATTKATFLPKTMSNSSKLIKDAGKLEEGPRLAAENILTRLNQMRGSVNPATGNINPKKVTGEQLRALDKYIKDNIGKYAADNNLLKMFKGLQLELRTALPSANKLKLAELDALYAPFKTLELAGQKAFGGVRIGLKDLKSASTQVSTKGNKAAYGEAPFQKQIDEGLETIAQETPNILFDVIKGFAVNIPSPTGLLERGGQIALGKTKAQMAIQNIAKRYSLPQAAAAARNKYNLGAGTFVAGMEQ
tara:strand:+ start:4148 stop:5701 length:1554 start_codon:yes stop_codon:yes gene_type:complete